MAVFQARGKFSLKRERRTHPGRKRARRTACAPSSKKEAARRDRHPDAKTADDCVGSAYRGQAACGRADRPGSIERVPCRPAGPPWQAEQLFGDGLGQRGPSPARLWRGDPSGPESGRKAPTATRPFGPAPIRRLSRFRCLSRTQGPWVGVSVGRVRDEKGLAGPPSPLPSLLPPFPPSLLYGGSTGSGVAVKTLPVPPARFIAEHLPAR
jgi:hypothetical protein